MDEPPIKRSQIPVFDTLVMIQEHYSIQHDTITQYNSPALTSNKGSVPCLESFISTEKVTTGIYVDTKIFNISNSSYCNSNQKFRHQYV